MLRCFPTHTSGALTLRVYSHTLLGLVVLAVSVTPGVVSSRLFSHALCGLVVLTVSVTPGVVSSRLFSLALRGLVVLAVSLTPSVVSSRLFSHVLCGLVVLAVSVTPSVVSSRLFSHALHGLVVLRGSGGRSAGHGDVEVGLWGEIICNLDLLCSALQALYAPPRHTTPMGFPSFQSRPKSQHKTKSKTKSQHESICGGQTKNEQNSLHLPSSALHRQISYRTRQSLALGSQSRSRWSRVWWCGLQVQGGGILSALAQWLVGSVAVPVSFRVQSGSPGIVHCLPRRRGGLCVRLPVVGSLGRGDVRCMDPAHMDADQRQDWEEYRMVCGCKTLARVLLYQPSRYRVGA